MANKGMKKQTVLSIVGIVLTIACAFVAVLWETVGRESYLYKEVLVTTRDINKGDVIARSDLKAIKIEEDKIIDNPIINTDDVVGMAAKQLIVKNTQITDKYLGEAELVLQADQFIFKVPLEWVIAVPSSIRRKDSILFYEISNTYSSQGVQAAEGEGTPVQSSTYYNSYELKDESWLKDFDVDSIVTKTDGKVQPPLFACTVAYVKDNANREVVNVGSEERYDASAQIASVEIIISLKELRAMQLSLDKGNRFILLSQEQ